MGGDCGNIYELRPVLIIRVLPQIKDHRLFQLKLEDGTTWESFGHKPGQFIEVSIFGRGEAPISISSPPTRPDTLEICVRRTGKVTNALFEMSKGSTFHIRGLYGRGFPVEQLKGEKLLFIAGGFGSCSPIILDVMMDKHTDGFDLCYSLKNDKKYKNIPILMVTAVTGKTGFKFSPETDGEYLQADDYVTKPVPSSELLLRVKKLIG